MGTNYYFKKKLASKEDALKEYEETYGDCKILDVPSAYENGVVIAGYKNKEESFRADIDLSQQETEWIHIGKRSFGWYPLFEAQEGLFSSIAEMKAWYENNMNEYTIISEYGEELTWAQLDEELINWKNDNSVSHIWIAQSNYRAVSKDMETEAFKTESREYNEKWKNGHKKVRINDGYYHYFTDDQGYEFTIGDFA